ncbi:MAG: AMP-binding protein [Sphingomonas bacterium]
MRDNAMPAALPAAGACVLRELVEHRAAAHPERVFAVFAAEDAPWTWARALADIRALAAQLHSLGVRQGDKVATWLPNGRRAVTAWLAINYLGAVYAPLNIAYRGRMLQHGLGLSAAKVLIAHADLLERLREIEPTALVAVIAEGEAILPDGVRLHSWRSGAEMAQPTPLERPIQPWDLAAIILTSGTTGPSKGVEVTYAQMWFSATGHPVEQGPEYRGLVQAPLFHVSGMGPVLRALVSGGSFAVIERFNTRTFWRDVRRLEATTATIMGSMASFLLSIPRSEDERCTTMKTMLISPTSHDTLALAERAGIPCYTVFSMSETAVPVTGTGPHKIGVCGRARVGITARVVDAHDVEVPRGEIGELVLRSDLPWAISAAYHGDPAATAKAWRNGWFHTGDAFRVDEDGDLQFIDRIKDAIRRRGENISSHEVETEVTSHPDIADCAAIAIASPYGEDDVMIVVEPVPGRAIAPRTLFEYLRPRMPHYMLPRYIRVMPRLPRTPTEKIQKHVLRDEGATPDTWDREEEGISVTADRIG